MTVLPDNSINFDAVNSNGSFLVPVEKISRKNAIVVGTDVKAAYTWPLAEYTCRLTGQGCQSILLEVSNKEK